MEGKRRARGVFYAVVGGICWGFSGCCGQYLFGEKGMDSNWLTAVRLLASGLILLAAALFTCRKQLFQALKSRGDLARILCFGVLGLMLCQLSYLTAIKYTNAATATVIQYAGPVLVMGVVCLRGQRLPRINEAAAILLAVAGTFLIATHGNPAHLVISQKGLVWCVVAALSVVAYTLIPGNLGDRYSSVVMNGIGMTAGGVALTLLFRAWTIPVTLDGQTMAAVVAIVVVGTVLAFSLYLQAIHEIGPVKASIIASVEPVSSAVISWLWLGSSFQLIDLVGFACILSTVFLLAWKGKPASQPMSASEEEAQEV